MNRELDDWICTDEYYGGTYPDPPEDDYDEDEDDEEDYADEYHELMMLDEL